MATKISKDHPIRGLFDECSGKFDCVTDAICAFNDILNGYGFHFDHAGMSDFHFGMLGTTILIYDDCGENHGGAYFRWNDDCADGIIVHGRLNHTALRPQTVERLA